MSPKRVLTAEYLVKSHDGKGNRLTKTKKPFAK